MLFETSLFQALKIIQECEGNERIEEGIAESVQIHILKHWLRGKFVFDVSGYSGKIIEGRHFYLE